jgi:hypothetical protein
MLLNLYACCTGVQLRSGLMCRGYSTDEDKQEVARNDPLIKSINLNQFAELLKWGVVMGVDDGCEPEAEEVRAGVAG